MMRNLLGFGWVSLVHDGWGKSCSLHHGRRIDVERSVSVRESLNVFSGFEILAS